jgi:hypothetical protein
MKKILKLLSCIVMPCAIAGPGISNSDPYFLLYIDHKIWTNIVHYREGMARVNMFEDRGKEGVKQVNLVIDCTNRTMALQGFQVNVGYDTDSVGYIASNTQPLTWYKPVTNQDLNIANAVCMRPIGAGDTASQQ